MGWVGLGPRIFDLPNVGLGTYFRQPNLPNNPLGQGNPSGQPYRTGTLLQILGYGDSLVRIGQNAQFILKHVTYILGFHINIASLHLFLEKGYNWNPIIGAV